MKTLKIGWAITGSHCTFAAVFDSLRAIKKQGHLVLPIASAAAATTDTRFGSAEQIRQTFAAICELPVITSLCEVEETVTNQLDLVVIAPCTGNTLAKLANAITDTAATMAAKAQLRNEKPVVLALASNDALAGNAVNWAKLLDKKGVYFVPLGQDNPQAKPRSLVADFTLLPATIAEAMQGRQIQPLLRRG